MRLRSPFNPHLPDLPAPRHLHAAVPHSPCRAMIHTQQRNLRRPKQAKTTQTAPPPPPILPPSPPRPLPPPLPFLKPTVAPRARTALKTTSLWPQSRPFTWTTQTCCKQTWCLTSTETLRLIRDGEKGGRGYGGEGRGRLYTYRYTVTTRMTPALRWAAM